MTRSLRLIYAAGVTAILLRQPLAGAVISMKSGGRLIGQIPEKSVSNRIFPPGSLSASLYFVSGNFDCGRLMKGVA